MNSNRIETIKEPSKFNKVLYLMTKSFRVNDNHSLEFAKNMTKNKEDLSIYLFKKREENKNNNRFFETGIINCKEALTSFSDDIKVFNEITQELQTKLENIDLVIVDFPYLKEDKMFVNKIAKYLPEKAGLKMIETNICVPVKTASVKEEYNAKTIRSKVMSKLDAFIDISTNYDCKFKYEEEAIEKLDEFIQTKLDLYHLKNNPEMDLTSKLSGYLKYGFISPITILNKLKQSNSKNKASFIEELVVRRELSYNFVYYNHKYDNFDKITYGWAYQTMITHKNDERQYLYSLDDYINFRTHDPYFNAAMVQMVKTGYMHGYMRMYWCKKIIEWSKDYREAYNNAIYLNNYYFLDGNTPNGYTGVAWCFGKHDRAWKEREIFGKLRYMNAKGLERKFSIDEYVKKMEIIKEEQ